MDNATLTGARMARVAVAGATGYAGSELVRLLAAHPQVELVAVTSQRRAGEALSAVHPSLRGVEDRPLVSMEALDDLAPELVFLALPHTISMAHVRALGLDRFRFIDLSGDFRLRSATEYERWYGTPHVAPEALAQAVYGLPELSREGLEDARLVANPGCYPTATILALAPLLRSGLIRAEGIIVDAKSGVTGAGATARPGTHFPRVHGNFNAYSLLTHRHTPEMEQALGGAASLLFTPHLLPVDRGILATAYAIPARGVSLPALLEAYHDAYDDEPFVRICSEPPNIKDVRGSNYCDLFVTLDTRTERVIALAVIDNPVKGAAGQAVQNMNLMFRLPEVTGLLQAPLSP